MKRNRLAGVLVWVLAGSLILSPWAGAQRSDTAPPTSEPLRTEELQQMLAPIALYPDALLAQILMASTYPLDVVEADRWVKQNPGLTGDELDAALQDKEWDASVKSLCHFPSVLSMMSERLQWTTRLGEAVLAQQAEVMDAVQYLRRKAYEQGNLVTNQQQTVMVEPDAISIEPPGPDVVYVPVYDPEVVYGPWWYPAYPPYLWFPGVSFFYFGAGIIVGAAIINWCGIGWRHHHINVDISRTVVFNRQAAVRGIQPGVQTWQHNPQFRRGVAYRNPATAQRFGQTRPGPVDFRPEVRGWDRGSIERARPGTGFQQPGQIGAAPTGRPSDIGRPQPGFRPAPQVGTQQVAPAERPPETGRPQTITRPAPQMGVPRGAGGGAFEIRRDGTSDRLAGERGSISRAGREFGTPQGGFRGTPGTGAPRGGTPGGMGGFGGGRSGGGGGRGR